MWAYTVISCTPFQIFRSVITDRKGLELKCIKNAESLGAYTRFQSRTLSHTHPDARPVREPSVAASDKTPVAAPGVCVALLYQ